MTEKPDMNTSEAEQRLFLSSIAYRTWNFFEENATFKTNFLPPDNIQGKDNYYISPYTSITNVGFYLISTLSAYELGYISLSVYIKRIEDTLATLDKLEKYRGLFFSYYDIYNLKPSKPYFIPSIDNGNFLACASTVAEDLRVTIKNFKFDSTLLSGLDDAVRECLAYSYEHPDNQELKMLLVEIKKLTSQTVSNLEEVFEVLKRITDILAATVRFRTFEANSLNKYITKLETIAVSLSLHINEMYCWDLDEAMLRNFAGYNQGIVDKVLKLRKSKSLNPLLEDIESILSKVEGASDDFSLCIQKLLTSKKEFHDSLIARQEALADKLEDYYESMDFSFLYNPKLNFMSVGFKVSRKRLEPYHYETLASESRLSVYLAIAKSDIPKKAWTVLTRKAKKGKRGVMVTSWGGSMFEYFMPIIFMKYSRYSVYKQTFDTFLGESMDFASANKIPWGISESFYNDFTTQGRYKYKAFGIQVAALNPNVDKRLVVSSYSTFITMPHYPQHAMKNVYRLLHDGALGEYGFFESIDYSKGSPQVVNAFMSHHQGMILGSLCNILSSNMIVRLFHANRFVKVIEYLLEENRIGAVGTSQIELKNVKNIKYTH